MVHLGIIPDGNRRWCIKNNKTKNDLVSHIITQFFSIFNEFIHNPKLKDITELSLYVLSIDNYNRNDDTIEFISNVIELLFSKISSNNMFCQFFNFQIIGDKDLFSKSINNLLTLFETKFKGQFTIHLAFGYDYNKDLFNYGCETLEHYNRTIPQSNIDLVIRSSGEKRLSGFFPTKTLYSELFFIDQLWPDVNSSDIINILHDFYARNRRFGK